MFHVEKVSALDRPELAPYATMRRSLEHEQRGIFVAEGVKVVERLLESHFTVVSVVLPEKWLEHFQPLLQKRSEDVAVYLAEKKLLESLTGFSMFQGVLAVGRIPAAGGLDDILAQASRPRLLVAVEGLTNAENLGALVRNCAAFGVQALVVGETSSSPFLRRAVRNSMGTIFQLPVIELRKPEQRVRPSRRSPRPAGEDPACQGLAQTLARLRSQGFHCVAAHPRADGRTLSQADFRRDCCIVFGSEGVGLSPAVLEACDEAVAIPMPPAVDSLNVGAAAAVFLYEASRQRQKA